MVAELGEEGTVLRSAVPRYSNIASYLAQRERPAEEAQRLDFPKGSFWRFLGWCPDLLGTRRSTEPRPELIRRFGPGST